MRTVTKAKYSVLIHRTALSELHDCPQHIQSELKDKAQTASEYKQPTKHSDIKLLRNANGLFRIRAGKYRAIADLEPPNLRILVVGHRDGVYDEIPEALRRTK